MILLKYILFMFNCCRIALHGLCFYEDKIVLCCYSPNEQINGGSAPLLFDNYKGEIIPKDLLFARMKSYSERIKNGDIPHECNRCFQIKYADWDESEYIDFIILTHYSRCNLNCIYCSNNLDCTERTNDNYSVLPFLKYLKSEGILKEDFELHIGGGEYTIYRECEQILDEFGTDGNVKIYVPTNAVKYSPKLYESIKSGNTYIIVSLDCGTKDTFYKIKRADVFDRVIGNLKKYASANPDKIAMKYIIIPGFNDSLNEFKKFLGVCSEIKVKNIRIDFECRYLRKVNYNINPYYFYLAEKMKNTAEKQGFLTEYYSFAEQVLKDGIPEKNIKKLIEYIKIKYFHVLEKELYTSQKYYT